MSSSLAVDTRGGGGGDPPPPPPSNVNSLVYSDTYGTNSTNEFSVDRYTADAASPIEGDSLGTLSIERTDTDRLETMMAKFDDAQQYPDTEGINDDDAAPAAAPAASFAAATVNGGNSNPGTPKELSRMLEKFDILRQNTVDSKLTADDDVSESDALRMPMTKDDDARLYRDKRQFHVLSPSSTTGEGFEVGTRFENTSHSSNDETMFEDLEQFRSADSHSEHPTSTSVVAAAATAAAAALGAATGASRVTSATRPVATDRNTQKILEERIVGLMNRVSKLELEKDELRTQKDDLQSQLHRVQHDQDVEDMYQNPYSDPFAGVATPTKSGQAGRGGGGSFGAAAPGLGLSGSMSFLESATSNLPRVDTIVTSASMGAAVVPVPSTVNYNGNNTVTSPRNNDEMAALHTEVTELRMKNQTLQADLETSDRVKERLKKVLKTVQKEDAKKLGLLKTVERELEESKERESVLKNELDECKVRLEGFEMAQRSAAAATAAAETDPGGSGKKAPGSPKKAASSSPLRSARGRRSFFSSSMSFPDDEQQQQANSGMPTQTGDVATALVVSQKQNEALEAFNKELELQNTTLQKKCDALNEKYGLSEPSEGDDKGKQLYSRYLEMKSSLSSLSVVLEEAKDDNTKLTERVAELETELGETQKKKIKQPKDANGGESVSSSSSSSIITPEQEKALQKLVEKLEVQILGYREAELQHQLVRAELEATVDRLDREAAVMREQLADPPAMVVSTADLERSYEALASKIATTEWTTELEALKVSMDAAAAESTRLLNELETVLSATREELETERTNNNVRQEEKKDEDFAAAAPALHSSPSSEQRLLDEIESLQKQTKQLKAELEQKAQRLEKSENRVATKHEQALKLTKANESLRDGIQKLKVHLSSISEQATTTEKTLAATKDALDAEKESNERLEVERRTLQTKIEVLQQSITDGSKSIDAASSETIELKSSLAASQKEVSLSRERVRKLVEAKKGLETALDATRDDLNSKLRSEQQRTAELGADLSSAERDLDATRLLVAAGVRKLVRLEESKLKDGTKLREVLQTTKEVSRDRTKLSETLKTVKAQLAQEKKDSEGLTAIKTRLETRIKGTEQCLEDVRNQNAKLTDEAKESSRQFGELEKLLATTQEELTEEEQRVETLEQQVDETTAKLREVERAKTELKVSLDTVKSQLFTVNAKNKTLECQLRAEKDYNSTNDEARLLGTDGSESASSSKDSDDNDNSGGPTGAVAQRIESLLGRLQTTESENAELRSSLAAALQSANANANATATATTTTTTTTTTTKPQEQDEEDRKESPSSTEEAAATEASAEPPQPPKEESTANTATPKPATEAAPKDSTPPASTAPAPAPPVAAEQKNPPANRGGIVTQSILDTATMSSYASTDSNSTDVVRRWEAELLLDTAKRDLADALKENSQLTGKVENLETSVQKTQQSNAQTLKECETHAMVNKEMAQKIDSLTQQVESLEKEKEGLMQRTAALARRDQLQRASLQTSNDEVATLMQTMSDFQQKFEILAEQVERGEAEKLVQIKEYEDAEARFLSEKIELDERIARLQKEYDALKEQHDELDSKHIQALMEEQSEWQVERAELQRKISGLEKQDSMKADSADGQAAEDSYYPPIRPSLTERSLMNQKVGEMEQDIQLLEVTMNDAKQGQLLATAELEVTRYKLSTCEEELEEARDKLAVCEEELKTCRDEIQTLVLKSATDGAGFQNRIRELEEELEAATAAMEETKKDHTDKLNACRAKLETAKSDHDVTRTVLEASKIELERCRKRYREAEMKLQDQELEIAKTALKERDNSKAASERESNLRLKHNACLQELKSCKKALESMAMSKTTELDAAVKEQERLQAMYEACRKELDACKEELTEKDKVMKHIAKKQVVEHQENDDEIRKNKQALSRLTDELNEAYVREKELEDKLEFAKRELFKTEKKVEIFETKITDGAGVYKEVIAKLNQSNDALTVKNQRLLEETKTLQKQVVGLQQQASSTNARGVAGVDSNVSKNDSNASEIEQENLVMKDLLVKSKHSVTDAKHMQKKLSSQVEAATKRETKLTREVVALKAKNAEMEQRLLDQEHELDEFENDFALARNDARKVVEELRSQLKQAEKRNQQLLVESSGGGNGNGGGVPSQQLEDLKARFKQLVHKNKRLQKEIDACRARENGGR